MADGGETTEVMLPLLPIRFLQWLPRRLERVFRHAWLGIRFGRPVYWSPGARPLGRNRWMWWAEWSLLWLDLIGLPEWYELITGLVKWNIRRLLPDELADARSVFGDSLPGRWIRLDDRGYIVPRRLRIAYVSFCTVNYWQKLRRDVLIHELVHVQQFHRYGSVYLVRALVAQRTPEGYNYGGIEQLRIARERGSRLADFNYEQRADIIADAWRIRHGLPPAWGAGTKADLGVYDYFCRGVVL